MSDESTDFPEDYAATMQHIEIIAKKRETLREAQLNAELQMLHRVGRDFVAGELSFGGLWDVYRRYTSFRKAIRPLPSLTSLWDAAIPISMASIRNRPRNYKEKPKPGVNGIWFGPWPLRNTPTPARDQSVVYVLFDEANVPCYVGSTKRFRIRLSEHHSEKRFANWAAYECDDRESAYLLEDRLLREHKPYLNKKASR